MARYKYLKQMLAVWSVLTLIAVGKAIAKKYLGFNAAANYASFSRQTKSIYVMKRLPSAKELHVRCLTLPAVACAVGFLVSLILLAIFAAVYHHGGPARCMPPAETLQIWEAYF